MDSDSDSSYRPMTRREYHRKKYLHQKAREQARIASMDEEGRQRFIAEKQAAIKKKRAKYYQRLVEEMREYVRMMPYKDQVRYLNYSKGTQQDLFLEWRRKNKEVVANMREMIKKRQMRGGFVEVSDSETDAE